MVRVSVDLVDTDSGAHLWAEKYDRDIAATSIFALQDDVTDRVVATIADNNGVLVWSMAAGLRDRPIGELSISELILRFFVFLQQVQLEEHARLRDAFERALSREPGHAEGWACLAGLIGQEHMWSANRLPDALERQRQAAQRAVDIDPSCQYGREILAAACYYAGDFEAFRPAAERAIALNPRNGNTSAFMGMLLAYSGDWERGLTIVRRAMALNPQHPSWYHFLPFYEHYRRGADAEALIELKRVNMPEFVWTHICGAAVCGQLGRSAEAESALASLRRLRSAFVDAIQVRELLEHWHRDATLVDRLMDGLRKAGLR
jgi:tetratricopeptide (TPR) repeat protein